MVNDRSLLDWLLTSLIGGPAWATISEPPAPVLERVYRAAIADGPVDPDEQPARLLPLLAAVREGRITPEDAAVLGAQWLHDSHLTFYEQEEHQFNVVYDVLVDGRQRRHRVDAVVYVDGIALALVQVANDSAAAQESFEAMVVDCPAWFVVPKLLVAMGHRDCAIGAHVAPLATWWRCAAGDLQIFVQPMSLLRIVLHDIPVVGCLRASPPVLAPPDVIVAAESALLSALVAGNRLISNADPLDLPLLLRSIARRFIDLSHQVFVVTTTAEMLAWLQVRIDEPEPLGQGEELPHHPQVVLAHMDELASRFRKFGADSAEERVVIAVGVEHGLLSPTGFTARRLFPDAVWISITMLEPSHVPWSLTHALGHLVDDDGLLAVVSPASR